MRDTSLGVAVQLENIEVRDACNSLRKRQSRLVMVLGELLKFWPEKRTREWMIRENPGLRGKKPIDLVNSEYATVDLLSAIRMMRARHRMKRRNSALCRLLNEPSILEHKDLSASDIPVELL